MTQEITPPYLRDELRKLQDRIQDLERNLRYVGQTPSAVGFSSPTFVAPVTSVGSGAGAATPPVVPPSSTDEVITISMRGVLVQYPTAGYNSGAYIPAINSHLRTITATVVTAASSFEGIVDIQMDFTGIDAPGNTFHFTPGLKMITRTVDINAIPGSSIFGLVVLQADGTIADLVVTMRFAIL